MRILVLPKWYPWPESPVFGVFCREQARAAARHHDVVVLAFRPEPMGGVRVFRTWEDAAEEPRTLRLVYRRPRVRAAAMATQLAGMAALVRGLRRSGWSPDVIHAHVFEAGLPALLLGRALGRPVVVSEHFTAFQRGLVQGVDLRLARAVFRRADLVCPVSEDLGRQLAAVEPQARLRVVPNVVDTELFHPAVPRRERGPGDPLRLLNVASLDEKKGHAVLLDAVARLRARGAAVTLDIVGEGELRGALEARSGLLGLDGVVRFQGRGCLPRSRPSMRESDLFVLPSRFENLPVVLLEAMASGLPAVASAVGGVGEIVDAASGELVPPGDADRLADAIAATGERLAAFDPQALQRRRRALRPRRRRRPLGRHLRGPSEGLTQAGPRARRRPGWPPRGGRAATRPPARRTRRARRPRATAPPAARPPAPAQTARARRAPAPARAPGAAADARPARAPSRARRRPTSASSCARPWSSKRDALT